VRLYKAEKATLAGIVAITGRFALEWVAGFDRNQRPTSPECATLSAAEARIILQRQAGAIVLDSDSRLPDEHPSMPDDKRARPDGSGGDG
jgi:hypothetical protein